MSIVKAEIKKDSIISVYTGLDEIGIRVFSEYWSADIGCLDKEQAKYHIGDSTVICDSGSYFTIIGKDHESVSRQIIDILKKTGAENVNAKSIENGFGKHHKISRLVELGILKKKEHSV